MRKPQTAATTGMRYPLDAMSVNLNECFKLDVRLSLEVAMFEVARPSTMRFARSWACVLLTIVEWEMATGEKKWTSSSIQTELHREGYSHATTL